mmetsp:Transcript_105648/g.215434  ORF Transcript_105648/g.215434 Transcript_105648/m.215434 type:complete len:92 (-) Transcript_105648:83-358(-)
MMSHAAIPRHDSAASAAMQGAMAATAAFAASVIIILAQCRIKDILAAPWQHRSAWIFRDRMHHQRCASTTRVAALGTLDMEAWAAMLAVAA